MVHVDEKTPHMHLSFVPITSDGRLSAKEIVGNKKDLTRWQDDFWNYMPSAIRVKLLAKLARSGVLHSSVNLGWIVSGRFTDISG